MFSRICIDRTRFLTALIASSGWIAIGLYSIYLKYVSVWTRYAGIILPAESGNRLTAVANDLSLFAADILLNFLAVPAIIAMTLYCLGGRRVILFTYGAVLLFVQVLLFANMHSWGTTGTYLTSTAAVDAAMFGWQNPTFIASYVDTESWTKLALVLLVTMLPLVTARKLANYKPARMLALIGAWAFFVASVATVMLSALSGARDTPVARSYVGASLASLSDSAWGLNIGDTVPTYERLPTAFHDITHSEPGAFHDHRFGAARGSDLIVFVLETGSERFLDLARDLDSFPTLERLSANSAIGLNHHTTFPGSAESLFSLFYSLYPPLNYYNTCVIGGDVPFATPFPGFVSALARRGYLTGLYLPYPMAVPLDQALYQNAGFQKIYVGMGDARNVGGSSDVQALEEMKADIGGSIARDQRYSVVFLPQIGHAPWPGRPPSTSVRDFGKEIAVTQDRWLAGIVEVVEQAGRLRDTVIVVTADHGIRTSKEDPDFRPGYIDNYTYRVPLLIFSPRLFPERADIAAMTSHLDLAPTLKDFFGVEHERSSDQGLNLWNPQLSSRRQYYLANWYFGADAYSDQGKFSMYSSVLDFAFTAKALHFADTAPLDSEVETRQLRAEFEKFYRIQSAWIKKFVCEPSAAPHQAPQ